MNPNRFSVRLSIVPLWLAIFGHSLANQAVRVYTLLFLMSREFRDNEVFLLFLWLVFTALPGVALAPLIGGLAANSSRRWIMLVSAILGLGIVSYCALSEPWWISCWAILALESAFFLACRLAIVPGIARSAEISFTHLQTLLFLASVVGGLAGIGIGLDIDPTVLLPGMPFPIQAAFVGFGISIITLFLVVDPTPSEFPLKKGFVRPFLTSVFTILKGRDTRNTLLFLWVSFAIFLLIVAQNGWLLTSKSCLNVGIPLLIGGILSGLHSHAYRCVGIVPLAITAFSILALIADINEDWSTSIWWLVGFISLTFVPTWTMHQSQLPDQNRGFSAAILLAGCGFITLLVAIATYKGRDDLNALNLQFGRAILILGLFATVFAWLFLFRPVVEIITEAVLNIFYKVKPIGPGFADMPWKGPCVLIANHAAWFDPLWLSKVVPMPPVPMMTARFFDLPVVSFLMRKVVGTIRVPEKTFRRDAPELQEAVRALEQNIPLMIFPEGYLRRKEEQPIRRFGRGIWEILKAKPDIKIYACWIEGGWGSYTSYKDGPPTKNKRIDIRRLIRISAIPGRLIDPKLLEDHMKTRTELMKWVLEARALHGLPPIELITIAEEKEDA